MVVIRKRIWSMLGNIGEKVSVNLLTSKFPEAIRWLGDKDITFHLNRKFYLIGKLPVRSAA